MTGAAAIARAADAAMLLFLRADTLLPPEADRRVLGAVARPACLRERVVTSGRRWESRGVWRTVWLMWRLRWRYWRGVAPQALAREYR